MNAHVNSQYYVCIAVLYSGSCTSQKMINRNHIRINFNKQLNDEHNNKLTKNVESIGMPPPVT